VLVVEDDRDVREMLDALLRYSGYTTVTARNGRDAFERLEERRPSLVLLDLMMPVMDGWEFRERQLEDEEFAAIPVICMTAMHEPEKASRALGVRVLQKPLDFEKLLEVVRHTCGPGTGPRGPFGPPRATTPHTRL
jgi:CheY-like chemotaxis protein